MRPLFGYRPRMKASAYWHSREIVLKQSLHARVPGPTRLSITEA